MEHAEKVESLIREISQCLDEYHTSHLGLPWREKVLLLVKAGVSFKDLGKNTDSVAATVSARERIHLYFTKYLGVVISAAELEIVSGISEYAKRVRELRTESGYKILTGYNNDPELGLELAPTDYILIDADPDITAAHRWHIAKRIRQNRAIGSQAKILEYFKMNIGQVVTTEELAYVSKARQYARRTRELRTEQGYAIATRFNGRPDLKMGEYILESLERLAEPHDRKIPFAVQKQVYERDTNSCRLCGWNRDKWTRNDPRILELHHINVHAEGGANTVNNLIVLCSRCHDKVHAGQLKLPPGILR